MDEISSVISSSAVVKAMQKVNLDYEPTDKEKLDEVMTHPELLARAVGMIVNSKTDAEIGRVLGLKPFTVGFIRENEFVRVLCEECFKESVDVIKNGLTQTTMDAVNTLSGLVKKDSNASDKIKYMASTAVINTVLKLTGELKEKNEKTTVNLTQINNNNIEPDAKLAYERAVRDMASILPVAENIYNNGDDVDGDTQE